MSTLSTLASAQPLFWSNPRLGDTPETPLPDTALIAEAQARLDRHAGLLALLFQEMASLGGTIRSRLEEANALRAAAGFERGGGGDWFIKRDDLLPVAGSIKARGGFHEVLAIAERIALQACLIDEDSPRTLLAQDECRREFARHSISVGSTGNLGLSVGVIGAALGFRTCVHMSVEAKEWKKQRLRARQVEVVEHSGDYEAAVAAGRRQAALQARTHFVDDESSPLLFFGYSTAARELAMQLAACGRKVDADHPLFVYIPCGVGGAPGGITFGLKAIFGSAVHCFFAEPCAAPCMLLRLAGTPNAELSVYDIGLNNDTAADGLAVARASPFVASIMQTQLSGVFTVDDARLLSNVDRARRVLGAALEPSAAAALDGPTLLLHSAAGRAYLGRHKLDAAAATHVIWTTGGSLVPAAERTRIERLSADHRAAPLRAA